MLIEQITTRPTAEINGIVGGYTGEGAKTVIPGEATGQGVVPPGRRAGSAKNPRCVPRLRARAHAGGLQGRVRQFRPGAADAAVLRQPGARQGAQRAGARNGASKAVAVGAGGSIPIVADFKSVLGMDSLLVGFALDDDRVHSPNEKFDLKCFHKGIRSWARILDALAA